MTQSAFKDHFSAVARDYARARPGYPDALFDWIAAQAPAARLAWEPACGSGQATAGIAGRFCAVHASDASADQIAQAAGPANVGFAVEPAERCSLGDASVDAVCVAQALHWFDMPVFFAECARVLRPGGLLVAWSYGDLQVPAPIAAPVAAFSCAIQSWWPAERALVGAAYAGFDWPFEPLAVPGFELQADWPLARLLAYFSSYSSTRRMREATGTDPVLLHAPAIARAWGDPAATWRLEWPLSVHARRKT